MKNLMVMPFVCFLLITIFMGSTESKSCTKWCPPPSLTEDQCKYVKFAPCKSANDCNRNGQSGLVCCPNGCGCACMEPKPKANECPLLKIKDCGDNKVCKTDYDCKGKAKCCANGCICFTDPNW